MLHPPGKQAGESMYLYLYIICVYLSPSIIISGSLQSIFILIYFLFVDFFSSWPIMIIKQIIMMDERSICVLMIKMT